MAHNEINLRTLSKVSFRPSLKTDGLNDQLKVKLGMFNKYEPARLAIAYSLALKDTFTEDGGEDEDLGKGIAGSILFGDDLLPVWISMIVESLDEKDISVDAIQKAVKNHWGRGISELHKIWKDYEEKNGNTYGDFILFLAEKAGLPESGQNINDLTPPDIGHSNGSIILRLGELGEDIQTGKEVRWHLNGKGSPHAAFMGGTGSGKSRLAKNLISQIRQFSNAPVLLFDFAKGDIANDSKFVNHLGATVIRCPENGPVPLDVLHIASPTPNNIANAAMRFRESFVKIPKSKPGAVQLNDLRDAAKNVFQKGNGPFKIEDINNELQAIYDRDGKGGDIITSTFADLMQWKLFEPSLSPSKFFEKSWVVDIHEADETAQRLVVFLILDALYNHIKIQPDSELDKDNNRTLKIVLVIDEARKVLKYGQESLISLIRESRSKGMSIFLISQSSEDFDTGADNFLEQIGFTACFSSQGKSSNVLKAVLGKNIDLASLQHGIFATRMFGEENIRKIKVWQ